MGSRRVLWGETRSRSACASPSGAAERTEASARQAVSKAAEEKVLITVCAVPAPQY